MGQGHRNAGTGARLSLSESPAGKYLTSIFTKLGLYAETHVHRRVAAGQTFLRDAGPASPQAAN
jgi:DNA-binding NarL/FixJ family response regulator